MSRFRFNLPAPLRGIYPKLMLAFVALVLTMGILVTVLAGRATRQEFHLYSSATGQLQAEQLAPLLADHYAFNGSWANVEQVLSGSSQGMMMGHRGGRGPMQDNDMWQMMGMQVLVANDDGAIVADTAGTMLGEQVNADSLSSGVPITVDDQQVGTVWVNAVQSGGTENDQFLQQVNRAIVLAALAAGLVALVLGSVITWGITRPLAQLTQAADAVARGDLSQRVSIEQQDQVGELGRAFNQMAERLERSENLRRQMTADIAHELRTPLAVILGNIEALQDGVFPLEKEALEPIHSKTRLLGRLVEDLRELAVFEAGHQQLDREDTDLGQLAGRTVDVFRATAEAKSVQLTLDCAAGLPAVRIDPQRIEQVLVNLLSNALRHTPEGGAVQVTIERGSDKNLMVSVGDSGPGVPAEEQSNIFERFYRIDKGRARREDQAGSGLGLAVARSIVEAHGGAIGVESAPGQGARFWFALPAG